MWVFGTSSVGKNTFINRIQNDDELTDILGWCGRKIAICKRSIDFPGDLGMPSIVKARKLIVDDTIKLLNNSDIVLIKWQYVDSSCETLQCLKKLLPNEKHRIILLTANRDIQIKRLNKKDWWRERGISDASKLLEYENKMVASFINDLGNEFKITTIDSSSEIYKVISD